MDGSLEIVPIKGPADIKNDVLRGRAKLGWRDAWTNGFVTSTDASESGLLMLDFYERTSTARIYEIYILEQFRQRGIGTWLVEFALAEAKKYGANVLELEAFPLDTSVEISRLRNWYSAMGFDGKPDTRLMTRVIQSAGLND